MLLSLVLGCIWIPRAELEELQLDATDLSLEVTLNGTFDTCDTRDVLVEGAVDAAFAGTRPRVELVLTAGETELVVEEAVSIEADGSFSWSPAMPAETGLVGSVTARFTMTLDDREETLTEVAEATAPAQMYIDDDGDTFGETEAPLCDPPTNAVISSGDCDDSDPDVRPDAPEICNAGIDDDCDGLADADDPSLTDGLVLYADGDMDSFGDDSTVLTTCDDQEPGYVAVGGDCDDTRGNVNPDATEVCNAGVDDDCNGLADADDPGVTDAQLAYPDMDTDGSGSETGSVLECTLPSGFVWVGGDCNDANPDIRPGAVELCNLLDDDCNGTADDLDGGADPFTVDGEPVATLEEAFSGSFPTSDWEIIACESFSWDDVSIDLEAPTGPLTLRAALEGLQISGGAHFGGGTFTLAGFELTGGGGGDAFVDGEDDRQGGALSFANGTVTLEDVAVRCAPAAPPIDKGGGLSFEEADVTLRGVSVEDCEADRVDNAGGGGGGIYAKASTVAYDESLRVENNHTTKSGGGLFLLESSLDYIGATGGRAVFSGNDADLAGGLYLFTPDPGVTSNLLVEGNGATTSGGGIAVRDTNTFELAHSQLQMNIAGVDGGGIYAWDDGTGLSITEVAFTDNVATEAGGGGTSHGNVVLVDVSIADNGAGKGGGWLARLDTLDELLVDQTSITDNGANQSAGIRVEPLGGQCGTVTLAGAQLSGNASQIEGGALGLFGQCSLSADGLTTFDDNQAVGGSGGAIFTDRQGVAATAQIELNRVDFTNNSAIVGGAIRTDNRTTATLTGPMELSDNTATDGGCLHVTSAPGDPTVLTMDELVFSRNTGTGSVLYFKGTALDVTCTDCTLSGAPDLNEAPQLANDSGTETNIIPGQATFDCTTIPDFCDPP